jgi:hypothetical protein
MTTHIARALLATLALVTVGFSTAALTAAPANAAEYCVYHTPTYLGNKEIVPAGRWCIPGP